MNFINPFDTDTGYYKELIEADAKPFTPGIEEVEYEEVSDDDVQNTVTEFIEKNTSKGFPSSAFVAIQKAKEQAALDRANQQQMADMFEKLFADLNDKYGLDVRLDFNSFSKSIEYIIEPTKKKAMEMYLSEAFGRFRVVLYSKYLQAISILSSQILNPDYLLSDSMTYDAKLQTMKQLYEFMQTMNEIYEQVNIPDSEMKLEKISEATHNTGKLNLNDPTVRQFLAQLNSEVKDGTDQE